MSNYPYASWTKEAIATKLVEDRRFLEAAILRIYSDQTESEKEADATEENNGVGFNGPDAQFGSSLARWIERGVNDFRKALGTTLTEKQLAAARKMMRKYAGQLARAAERKQAIAVEQDARKYLDENREPKAGVECCFVGLNEKYGFKWDFRQDAKARRQLIDRQALLASHGYAPAVIAETSANIRNEGTVSGWITERVPQTLWEAQNAGKLPYPQAEADRRVLELINGVESVLGMVWSDCHRNNIGIMDDGRLVCIDTGHMEEML